VADKKHEVGQQHPPVQHDPLVGRGEVLRRAVGDGALADPGHLILVDDARRIHEAHPDVCVVLLSTYTADDLPADALATGAAAYINKDEFGPQVLRSTWDGSGPNGDAPASAKF
jgi:hypothetical protein